MIPLMPKATAVWLVDNTRLTFQQIADFCGLHILEIQAIADDSLQKVAPFDPIAHSQLTNEEIIRCEHNPTEKLKINIVNTLDELKHKGAKYTPKAKRQMRPNGILWLLKEYPVIPDNKISTLLGVTKNTVAAIRNKSYKYQIELKPQDPVKLGLCSQKELDHLVGDYMNIEGRH